MKLRSFFLCFFILYGTSAGALADINAFGEMDIGTELNLLPTSEQGNTAFRLPRLWLGVDVPLRDNNAIEVLLEGAEKRDPLSHRFDVQVKEAYLDLTSPFAGMRSMRYGLIPNSWQENQRTRWDFEFLGPIGLSLTEKNAYISRSDLGLVYLASFADKRGEWSVSFSNGEGMESDEVGPRKEGQLFFSWAAGAPFYFNVGYILGAYDQYDPALAKKERIQGEIIYDGEGSWMISLEWLDAHDPADAFSLLKMAQGVDLTNYLGQNIHGQGGALSVRWDVSLRWSAVGRFENLQVVAGKPEKATSTAWGGVQWAYSEDIALMLAYNYSWFPQGYGVGVRDQSAVRLGTQVSF